MICTNCGQRPADLKQKCRRCYMYEYRHGRPRPVGMPGRPAKVSGMLPVEPLMGLIKRASADIRDRRQEDGQGPSPDDQGYRSLARFLAGDDGTMTEVRCWERRMQRLKQQRSVGIDIAEDFVSRLGLHPSELWPNWHSVAAAVVEEQFGHGFMEEAI